MCEVHRPGATIKNVALEWIADKRLPPRLTGDAGRIRQILHNLLSNAVKFTEAGAIVVRARCVDLSSDAAMVEWTVSDSGIGIAPAKLDRLFDSFTQADDSITRRFGGSGLGLAISRQLVDLMNGELTVESVEREGSTFTLRLRLPIAEPASAPAAATGGGTADFTGRVRQLGRPVRALLVEDNRTNQFLIEQMLKDHPIELTIAWNGAEAVEAAARDRFDLVFMDMRMPVMDGLEATQAIRAGTGLCRDVPIIAMTANAYQEDQDACMAAGMTDFIAKPISRQALLDAIVKALPKRAAAETITAELSPGS